MADNSTYLASIPSGHIEGSRWISNTRDADKPLTTAQTTALGLKMSRARFSIVNTLPPSPVDGLGLVAMPKLALCKFTSANKVYEMLDPISGVKFLQNVDSLRPTIHIDDNGVEFLRFNGGFLSAANVPTTALATGGTKTSFMVVAKTTSSASPHFELVPESGTNGIIAWLPMITDLLAVGHGNSLSSITSDTINSNYAGTLSNYYYMRDGSNAEIWFNGVKNSDVSTHTGAISGNGTLKICAPTNGITAHMDFYGLAVFPKVLTPVERKRMFIFSKYAFGA